LCALMRNSADPETNVANGFAAETLL
jgi:hypothetical protein